MRICSLVPAATEVLRARARGPGRRRHPRVRLAAGGAAKPVVTASLIQTGDLASGEIDRAVAETAREGKPPLRDRRGAWAEVEADVVVMQEPATSAPSPPTRSRALRARPLDVGCSTSRRRSASRTRSASSARGWQSPHRRGGAGGGDAEPPRPGGLGARGPSRRRRASSSPSGSEPPYSAGHWVPDMVAAARGTDVAGMSGEPSHRMRWPDVAALEPDVVVLAPCGFDLDRTLSEVVRSTSRLTCSARRPARRAASSPSTRTRCSRGRAPRTSTASSPSRTCCIPSEYPDPGALEPHPPLGKPDAELPVDELDR